MNFRYDFHTLTFSSEILRLSCNQLQGFKHLSGRKMVGETKTCVNGCSALVIGSRFESVFPSKNDYKNLK